MTKWFSAGSLIHGQFSLELAPTDRRDLLGRFEVFYQEPGQEPYSLGFVVSHLARFDYTPPLGIKVPSMEQYLGLMQRPAGHPFWSVEGQEYEEDGTPHEFDNPEAPCHNLWIHNAKAPRYIKDKQVVVLPTDKQDFQILED